MAALTPYVSPFINPHAIQAGLTSLGAAAAAIPSVSDYADAARSIQKSFRAARFRKSMGKGRKRYKRSHTREHVGQPVGTGTTQRWEPKSTGLTNIDTRTLYVEELTTIPQATTSFDINGRRRAVVQVSGLKLCLSLKNVSTEAGYFNVAVISPKGNKGTPDSTEFFRSQGSARAVNLSTALTALEFHCLPINSDVYNVLFHKRFQIGSQTNAGGFWDRTVPNYLTFSKWVKLNRQIRYNASDTVEGACYIVYWCDLFSGASTTAVSANAMQVGEHHVTYFREINK